MEEQITIDKTNMDTKIYTINIIIVTKYICVSICDYVNKGKILYQHTKAKYVDVFDLKEHDIFARLAE